MYTRLIESNLTMHTQTQTHSQNYTYIHNPQFHTYMHTQHARHKLIHTINNTQTYTYKHESQTYA